MKKWTTMGLSGSALGCVSIIVAVAAGACSSTKTPDTTPPVEGGTGVACVSTPGAFPAPDCEAASFNNTPGTNNCPATAPGCAIDENLCGSKSTCLPMAKNDGKSVLDLRIRRLNVAAPAALASPFVEKAIVDQGINLKSPTCGEKGDGAFNWLIRVDKTAGTVTTGGAPPSDDPFGKGYCFVNMMSGALNITPVTKKITFTGNSFTSETVDRLNVPIFVHGDVNNVVILPLQKATFKDVTLSADGNCIGSLNYNALDTSCSDVRTECSKWHTAGSLGGFITLDEADAVALQDLGGKSLCYLLVNDATVQDGLLCKRDASKKIVAKGDFCSTTNTPGGCQDSYWLTATFAAAAVKIHDGTGVATCTGAAPVDAGTD